MRPNILSISHASLVQISLNILKECLSKEMSEIITIWNLNQIKPLITSLVNYEIKQYKTYN